MSTRRDAGRHVAAGGPGPDGPGLRRGRLRMDLARRLGFLAGDTLNPDGREFLPRSSLPSVAKPMPVADLPAAVRRPGRVLSR